MCISYKIMPLNPPALHATRGKTIVSGALWRQNNARVDELQQQRKKDFQTTEPAYDDEVAIDGQVGALPIMTMRRRLSLLPVGSNLRVGTCSRPLAHELAAAARLLGYCLVEKRFRKHHFLYVGRP